MEAACNDLLLLSMQGGSHTNEKRINQQCSKIVFFSLQLWTTSVIITSGACALFLSHLKPVSSYIDFRTNCSGPLSRLQNCEPKTSKHVMKPLRCMDVFLPVDCLRMGGQLGELRLKTVTA